jgi:hypothetical protein
MHRASQRRFIFHGKMTWDHVRRCLDTNELRLRIDNCHRLKLHRSPLPPSPFNLTFFSVHLQFQKPAEKPPKWILKNCPPKYLSISTCSATFKYPFMPTYVHKAVATIKAFLCWSDRISLLSSTSTRSSNDGIRAVWPTNSFQPHANMFEHTDTC